MILGQSFAHKTFKYHNSWVKVAFKSETNEISMPNFMKNVTPTPPKLDTKPPQKLDFKA